MTPAALPCAHCGGQWLRVAEDGTDKAIVCRSCGHWGQWAANEGEALAAWNGERRTVKADSEKASQQ